MVPYLDMAPFSLCFFVFCFIELKRAGAGDSQKKKKRDILYEPAHDNTSKMACAPREDSIRVFPMCSVGS